ncbi:hypothetical protein N7454_003169 [Penicillium verhagenii]|nr:hypothetical protein N7454_003169 [Penicillium verhagenii]
MYLSAEDSGSKGDYHSPSTIVAAYSQINREKFSHSRSDKNQSSNRYIYCTMDCIHGIVNGGPLDTKCPNLQSHLRYSSSDRHSIGPTDFTCRLHSQLVNVRDKGFEQLHIRGRTSYLMKATLLSHGYAVVIKATTVGKQHRLQVEVKNYNDLTSLQGR